MTWHHDMTRYDIRHHGPYIRIIRHWNTYVLYSSCESVRLVDFITPIPPTAACPWYPLICEGNCGQQKFRSFSDRRSKHCTEREVPGSSSGFVWGHALELLWNRKSSICFFKNTSWGDVWRGERQTIAVWGRTCLWAIAVVSEGTCRLAHLRMPTRSRGLERKDLLSRANEHRLLGRNWDEIEGSWKHCSALQQLHDARFEAATSNLHPVMQPNSSVIPRHPKRSQFELPFDHRCHRVGCQPSWDQDPHPWLGFRDSKTASTTFSHADTIYLDQLHGLRRLRTSSIFIFDSAPVSRQGLYFRRAFAEKQDWCFATGFQADFGLWTSLKHWNCATDYILVSMFVTQLTERGQSSKRHA